MERRQCFTILEEIAGLLRMDQSPDQLLQEVVMLAARLLDAEDAALFLKNDAGTTLRRVAGSTPQANPQSDVPSSITQAAFEHRRVEFDNSDSPLMAAPLLIGTDVVGVLQVLRIQAQDRFGDDDHVLLRMIATHAALAIRSIQSRERDRYFEQLVYNSPDPICVLDASGRVRHFNQECERLFGISEREVIGTPVHEFYESVAHAREIGRALRESPDHTIRDYSAIIRDASGTQIPIRLSATLLRGTEWSIAGSIGVFKDQRDYLRQQEERLLAEKLAAIGHLTQSTVHDVKNDLGAALNYVHALEEEAADRSDIHEICVAIREAMLQAMRKMQKLLMVGKPAVPQLRVVSLGQLLRNFCEDVRTRAAAMNTHIALFDQKCDITILADEQQLQQLLANLFDNSIDAIAVKRMASGDRARSGQIDLGFTVVDEQVVLSWRDNGCGLPASTLANVFKPFFTTKTNGSGLGLFLAKGIVERHGGEIAAESPWDAGACFRIALPIHARPRKTPAGETTT